MKQNKSIKKIQIICIARSKFFLILYLIALFLFSHSSGQADTRPGSELKTIVLQLPWNHQFQFAGYYAAVRKGFYEKKGFKVRIIEGGNQNEPSNSVLEGSSQFGVEGSELLYRRLQGAPLVALGVVFQHSPYALMSLKNSSLHSPLDFIGHNVQLLLNNRSAEFFAMFKHEDIGLDRINQKTLSWNLNDLISGKTDAVAVYMTNEPFLMREKGIEVNLLRPFNYGVDFYGDTLFTSEKYAADNADTVEAFRDASFKGWNYAFEHEDEIISEILEKYADPSQKLTAPQLKFQAETMHDLVLPSLVTIGQMNPSRWQKMATAFVELGMIEPDSINRLNGFMYTGPNIGFTPHWLKWLTGIALALVTVTFIALMATFRLRHLVLARTKDLNIKNVSLINEIKNRQESEKLLKEALIAADIAYKAKSEFLSNMSHEIRTPLGAILGFADLMLRESSTIADQNRFATVIKRNGLQLVRIIDEILDLSKIEAGRMQINQSDFNFRDAIREMFLHHTEKAHEKNLQLILDLDDSVPIFIRSDKSRVKQIINTLIGNAIKFTESGIVKIRAYSCLSSTAQSLITYVEVEDTGNGILPDQQSFLFQPFSQADTSSTRRFGGTGLGLALCQRLAKLLGGELCLVKSHPSSGSVFRLTVKDYGPTFSGEVELSYQVAQTQKATNIDSKMPTATPRKTLYNGEIKSITPEKGDTIKSLNGLKILVVEDAADNRFLVKTLLTLDGASVEFAENGKEGFEKAIGGTYDMVLMDIQMPVMDGYEATSRLRKHGFKTPIIALTAHSSQEEKEKCFEIGCNDHVAKPVNRNILLEAIVRQNKKFAQKKQSLIEENPAQCSSIEQIVLNEDYSKSSKIIN